MDVSHVHRDPDGSLARQGRPLSLFSRCNPLPTGYAPGRVKKPGLCPATCGGSRLCDTVGAFHAPRTRPVFRHRLRQRKGHDPFIMRAHPGPACHDRGCKSPSGSGNHQQNCRVKRSRHDPFARLLRLKSARPSDSPGARPNSRRSRPQGAYGRRLHAYLHGLWVPRISRAPYPRNPDERRPHG